VLISVNEADKIKIKEIIIANFKDSGFFQKDLYYKINSEYNRSEFWMLRHYLRALVIDGFLKFSMVKNPNSKDKRPRAFYRITED
jgi:hypothetical protein